MNSEVSRCLQLTFKWDSVEEKIYVCTCKKYIYNLCKLDKANVAKYIQSIFSTFL